MSSFPDPDFSGTHRPDFGSKDAEAFEYLCLDLARAHFAPVISGDLHERGTAQNGVDFLIDTEGLGLIAGSCRSDEDPDRGRIVGAAEEFADAWETVWRAQGVTQFVLCLAAEARRHARKNNIAEAREIILGLGIACEVWTQSELIDLLRPHPSVVLQHLSQNWARKLCIPESVQAGDASNDLLEALERQIEALKASQAPLMRSKMDHIAALFRQGARREAAEEASKLKADAGLWRAATPEQRATLIRSEVLGQEDDRSVRVRSGYREAAKLYPPKDRFYDLKILAAEEGFEAALKALSFPRTLRERTLKAAFQLEASDAPAALATLGDAGTRDAFDVWAHRVHAIASAINGDMETALEAAENAVRTVPDDLAAKQTRAAVYFSASVAPGLGFLGVTEPQPYTRALVRGDATSKVYRRKATDWFEDLAASAPEAEDRETAWLWTFVASLDDLSQRARVLDMIERARDKGCLDPAYVTWCLGRGVSFDQGAARDWLEARLERNSQDRRAATALYFLVRDAGDMAAVRDLLSRHRAAFEAAGGPGMAAYEAEINELEAAPGGALSVLANPGDEEITAYFSDPQQNISARIETAKRLAELEQWEVLLGEREFLLDEAASPTSFEIMAHAIAASDGPKAGLDFFEAHKATYLELPLNPHFQSVYIGFLANAGRSAEALSAAEAVYTEPSDPNYLLRAQFQLNIGNPRGAGIVVRRAFEAGHPSLDHPEMLMRWANTLAADDPATSIMLLDASFARDRDVAIRCGGSFLAMQLIPGRAGPFVQHMHAYALAHPDGPIRPATIEEARDWMIASRDGARRTKELYGKGHIFGHGVFGDKLGLVYLTPVQSSAHFDGILPQIAHGVGGRDRTIELDEVVMDPSAILVAEVLDIWPLLDRAEIEVVLPDGWSVALIEMERAARPNQPDRLAAAEKVLTAIDDGVIQALDRRPVGTVCVQFEGDATAPGDVGDLSLTDALIDQWIKDQAHVFIANGVGEPLAARGDLDKLIRCVRLSMSKQQQADLRAEVLVARNGERVADQIKKVRQHLSADLRADRIRQSPAAIETELTDEDGTLDYSMRAALSYSSNAQSALWSDDRFMTGHTNGPRLPIIGVQSVLGLLQRRGIIDANQMSNYRHELRRLGFDFVLPTADEIYGVLRVDWNGDGKPSPRLGAMRRTFARFSQKLVDVFGPLGLYAVDERQAAFEQYLLASHVVQRILENSLGSKDLDLSAILWVTEAFRVDWRKGTTPEGAKQICEMWHSSVVLSFLPLAGQVTAVRRAEFSEILNAVYANLVTPAIELNSGGREAFAQRIAEVVEGHLQDLLAGEWGSIESEVGLRLLQSFLEVCPNEIEDLLCRTPSIRSALRLTHGVGVAEFFFAQDALWTAVDSLIMGAEQVERQDEGGQGVVFSRMDEVHIRAECEGRSFDRIIHPAIGASDPGKRRDAFDSVLTSLKLCATDATHWRRRLGQARTAERRAALLDELADSPEGRLNALTRLKSGDPVAFDQLAAPPLEEMWRWLSGGAALDDGIEAAFETLSQSVGIEEAALRWSGVPVHLPSACETWFEGLSDGDASDVARRLGTHCIDPVARRNLIKLLGVHPGVRSVLDDIVSHAGEEGTEWRLAELHYARAVSIELVAGVSSGTPLEKIWVCAWAWTGRVFSRLIPANANMPRLSDEFLRRQTGHRLTLGAHLASDDVLDPGFLSSVQFFAGLGGCWMAADSEVRSEKAVAALSAEVSFQNENAFPHPAILTLASQPNASGSWFGRHAGWAIEVFSSEDPTVARMLGDRAGYVDEVFERPVLYLNDLYILGLGDLSPERTGRVLEEAGRWIRRADEAGLQLWAALLFQVSPSSEPLKERTIELFVTLFRRAASVVQDDQAKQKDLHFLMEVGLRLVIKLRPNNHPALLDLLLVYEAWVWGQHRDEVAIFVGLIADTIPMADRAPFLEIAARLSGAPFP